jgi:ubiquinone/menaquinone biosynthesis C-methylase UbiE
MEHQGLQATYDDLAELYDLIEGAKDYEAEAARLQQILGLYKRTPGDSLLEVACGTGKYLSVLVEHYRCTGVDISQPMLEIARRNVPDAEFIRVDMVDMDLGRSFDVLICLFSSIGYVRTRAKLDLAIRRFADHLLLGGVVVIEPWLTPEAFRPGEPFMDTYDGADVKIARLGVNELTREDDTEISVLEFDYLIARDGKPVQYVRDRHELGLFGHDRILETMRSVGLETTYLEKGVRDGRGVFVGTKPIAAK